MAGEGFRILNHECIQTGLCYECGLCASVCPSKAIDIRNYDWGNNPELTGKCIDEGCTRCYDVCAARIVPVTQAEEHFFGRKRRTDNYEKVGGVCRWVGTGCTTDPEIRKAGVSGGVASTYMIYALEKGLIDGCVLAGWDPEKPYMAKALVARNREEVLACAGSKYQPHPQLLGIREAYEMGLRKIAVSTTPCHAQSLRKMMMSGKFPEYTDMIKLISCNFCAAHWALAGTKWLLDTWFHVKLEDVKELRYRTGAFPGSTTVVTKDGKVHEQAFVRGGGVAALGRFTPEDCRVCLEKVGYSGDIVFGDTWYHPSVSPNFDVYSPPTEEQLAKDERMREAKNGGLSTVVVRSAFAEEILKGCLAEGRIKLFDNTEEETTQLLTGVAAEKTTWYTPWINARKHRGMPTREYI